MSKILSIDIGSNSCKLVLTEKVYNTLEVLFYAEKTYAEPVRERITSETAEIVENQIKNLIRDFRNVENEISQCNIAFGGSSVNSTIIESSIDKLDSSKIISQDQLNLLTKNNPKINSFITKSTAHIIPLEYSLDGMVGIRHPLGMHTRKLSVNNLYVNIEKEDIDIIKNIISNAGLSTNIIVSESIVSSLYLLNSDEKEIGSLIVDIGAGSTDYCYSKKGKPVLIGSLPVGGNQFTSDLSIAFSTNKDFANQLKFETSCTPENERIAEKVIIKQEQTSKTFEITIPVGYYTAAALATTINTLITQIPNHKVQSVDPGETSLGMVFSQDQTNYNINVSLTYGGTGSKYMAPRNGKNNLWKLLGFSETQVLNIMKRKIRGINDTDEPNFSDVMGGLPSTSAYPSVVLAGTSGTPFVLSGVFPATIESPEGMFITSETLTTGGTYETRINQDTLHMEAFPTSILEFIHYISDRFSWIHYNTSTPHYHYLNKTSIHELDIQLRSANMTILSHKEIGEYNMVLVFECLAEPEFGPKFIKEWNDEGYRMAHEKERVIGF